MTRVDLDAIQARADAATPGPWVFEDVAGTVMAHPQRPTTPSDDQLFISYARTDVLAMVVELRAAREVVKAARWIERTGALPPSNEIGARRLSDLEQAVRDYEQVVAP